MDHSTEKTTAPRRRITFAESAGIMLLYIVMFLYGSGILGNTKVTMAMSMFICTVITAIYAMLALRITWKELNDSILATLAKAMPSIFLLMMVGFLAASWLACGTTPALIYYGMLVIKPQIFLLAAFLICALCSNLSGSSWSTVATFGLAFFGIAQGLGMPVLVTVGAIICGAFIGDKWSPMSDSTNLCAALTETDVFELFGHLMPTNGIATAVTAVIFLGLGISYAGQAKDMSAVMVVAGQITDAFHINVLLLIPIILIVVLSIKRKPTLPVLILSVLTSVLLGMLFQGRSYAQMMGYLWKGFVSNTGNAEFDSLVSGGGLLNVGECVFIMFIALAMAGVLEQTKATTVIAEKLAALTKNRGMLVITALFVGIFGTFLGATSYTGMIMVTSMFAPMYEKAGFSKIDLARTAVSAGLVSFLVPWGSSHNLIAANLGVTAGEFGPYCFILWIVLGLNILYGFTGWFSGSKKAKADRAAQ